MEVWNLVGQDNFWQVSKNAARRIGLIPAVVLSELAGIARYADSEAKRKGESWDGWFYRSGAKITEQMGIGKDAHASAVKLLLREGLIERKIKGSPPTAHYHFSEENEKAVFSLVFDGKSNWRESDNPIGGNPTIDRREPDNPIYKNKEKNKEKNREGETGSAGKSSTSDESFSLSASPRTAKKRKQFQTDKAAKVSGLDFERLGILKRLFDRHRADGAPVSYSKMLAEMRAAKEMTIDQLTDAVEESLGRGYRGVSWYAKRDDRSNTPKRAQKPNLWVLRDELEDRRKPFFDVWLAKGLQDGCGLDESLREARAWADQATEDELSEAQSLDLVELDRIVKAELKKLGDS